MKATALPLCLLALVASCFQALAIPPKARIKDLNVETVWKGNTGYPSPKPHPPLPFPPPRPLVIWHGLGDNYASAGMTSFIELVKEMHKGIFIYSVRVSDDPSTDERAAWFGNVDKQVAQIADVFSKMEELKGGFDAIGFSQGGQFLRAYIERYNSPRVFNLITFGSQHMGISDLPGCKPTDFLCRAARSAAGAGVYTTWAQNNLVQAQYFRDHQHYQAYLSSNHFLRDINNESLPSDEGDPPRTRNETYFANLVSIENLVLVLFDQDRTVVPKESSWFGSYAISDDYNRNDEPEIVDMKNQPLYKEDWIGLRTLDEAGKVYTLVCEGEHMVLSDECWRPIVKKWVGTVNMDVTEDIQIEPVLDISPLLLQDW